MAKKATVFVCQNCNSQFPKWAGQCASCGQWNSLVETMVASVPPSRKEKTTLYSASPVKISQVKTGRVSRQITGIKELDRVLGGGPPAARPPARQGEAGIVPGSVVLIAGSPGMGKSTLLTQLALSILKSSFINHKSVLYVCGEESPSQVKMRVERLNQAKPLKRNLLLLPETNTEAILDNLEQEAEGLGLVIVDSIQTLWTERLTGVAGSVGQVRESASMLLKFAKASHLPIFLVGHVTKEGAIAGPKVLEHLVDVVLYLEGDGKHEFRLLRSVKNRFGGVDEVGVFLMRDSGLEEVNNPSEIFLPETGQNQTPGSVVVVSLQGIRPILVEIQALVTFSSLAIPRRIGAGIDQKRLQVLCAILQRHANLKLADKDVYVNVAGGLTLREPAADLGICLAIASSYKNKPVKKGTVAIGEVGLLGEIRRVSFMEKRIKEAKIQGFRTTISQQTGREIRTLVQRLF